MPAVVGTNVTLADGRRLTKVVTQVLGGVATVTSRSGMTLVQQAGADAEQVEGGQVWRVRFTDGSMWTVDRKDCGCGGS